VLEA
jgi:catechol 2,3-dioxygenase-like lactoylglutathione lyase family enzyme